MNRAVPVWKSWQCGEVVISKVRTFNSEGENLTYEVRGRRRVNRLGNRVHVRSKTDVFRRTAGLNQLAIFLVFCYHQPHRFTLPRGRPCKN